MGVKRDSIGMFHVLKGALMLIIVFVHHYSFVNGGMRAADPSAPLSVFTGWSALTVGLFFVIAGYQFRPSADLKKSVRKQFYQLMVPYGIVICIVAVCRFVISFLQTGQIRIQAASTILVGGFYGVMENTEIFGIWGYSVVALWFLPVFFVSGVLFSFLHKLENIKIRSALIWVLTMAAVFFPDIYQIQLPWFIVQSCAVLGLMEVGAFLRERKILYRRLPWWFVFGAAGLYIFCHIFSQCSIGTNVYQLKIVDYGAAAMMSVVVLRCYVHIGAGEWKWLGILDYIGMYSMLFFLLHGAGLLLIPWEAELGSRIMGLPLIGDLPFGLTAAGLYVVRCAGILLGCVCFDRLIRFRYTIKRKREEKK